MTAHRSRTRLLKRALLGSTALLPALALLSWGEARAQAVNIGQANGNLIIPDGRTATHLSGNGRTTDITTSTMSGGNAYNSFSQFKAGAGNTVNLHVPNTARNLVNIVRDGPVDIQGTLNSYKNGQIGGNVVFSDSYGFVVGPSGSVNVGSLSVVTPTRDFNERLLGANGQVDQALAARLLAGNVPISPDGRVSIAGRINARRAVQITAHDVVVAGSLDAAAREAQRKAQFEATVNTSGLVEGGAIVVRNGRIAIVASNDARIGGRLEAGGTAQRGGAISIQAGREVTLAASAQVSAHATHPVRARAGAARRSGTGQPDTPFMPAAGPSVSITAGSAVNLAGAVAVTAARDGIIGRIDVTSAGNIALAASATLAAPGTGKTDGGRIVVKADKDLTVADGARVRASAAGTGNGGFVELSGLDTARIGRVDLDLTARAGKAGTLLIDPNNLIIGGTSQGGTGDAVTIDASFTPNLVTKGANVVLQANSSITIASGGLIDTRRLDAAGTYAIGDSGSVFLSAPTITVAQGGQIRAEAVNNATAGNATLYAGGLVALQAQSTGLIVAGHRTGTEAGGITIAGTVRAGAVLLDAVTPDSLTTGGGSAPVTIKATGIIDTTGAGQQIVTGIATLTSANTVPLGGGINIYGSALGFEKGSVVAAPQAGGAFPGGGAVLIAATASESQSFGKAEAAATVDLQGTVTGGTIAVSTDASAVSSLIADFANNPANAITVGALTEVGAGLLLGAQAGYNGAKSTSTITVGGIVTGTRDVSFVAKGLQTAADLGITFTVAHPLAASAWYGAIDATTAVTIAKTAQVSGANITAQASNTATLGVSAMAVSLAETPALAAVAVGRADIATSATVATGATLKTTGNVSVTADNTNSFSTSATTLGFGSSLFGVGIAVSNTNAAATASLGADLGAVNKVGNVTVQAISDTLLNKTAGSAAVGDPPPFAIGRSLVPDQFSVATLAEKIGKVIGQTPLTSLSPAQALKGTIGLSYGRSSQSAQATIGSDAGTPSALVPAPTIDALGNVSVVSRLYDAPIRSDAGASNTSSASPSSSSPQATGAANVALAVGIVDHTSNAVIGPDTTVDAKNVAVSAKTDVPFGIAWDKDKLASTGDVISAIVGTANGNGGVINNVMTSASTATTDAAEFGIAASINILGIDNSTTAWIANGARITTRDTSGATWGPALIHDNVHNNIEAPVFKSGLDVNAGTVTQTINLAGSPSWFIVTAGNGATTTTGQNGTPTKGSDGASAGGSVNINMFESKTVAGLGDGVTVNAATDVSVNAWAHDQVVTLVPSSGAGAAFGVTGLVSVLTIENVTHASISRTAQLTARAVDVEATQDNRIITLSGALTRSTGTSVGLSAVWANIAQDTKASIGDNADDVKDAGFGTSLVALPTSGSIATSALTVQAATSGTVFALSVAASVASPNDPDGMVGQLTGKFKSSVIKPGLDKTSTKLLGGVSLLSKFSKDAADKLTAAVKDGFAKVSETVNQTTAADTRTFSITATGSLTGVTTQIDTVALLDRANVVRLGQQAGPAVTVQAFNTSITSATSGAASATLAGAQPAKLSAAVSGALALMVATDETHASVAGSNLGDTGDVAVQALAGGQKLALGIGLAVDTNATSTSLSFAGSLSAGFISDSVTATVTDSVLRGAGNGRLTVSAYQSTDMALGGVAIGVSAKGLGVGTAVTIGVVQDLSDDEAAVAARVRNTSVTGYTDMTVEASSVARILAAAGVAAVAPGSLALSGSFVFNTISPTVLAEVVGTGTNAPAVETSNTLSVIASSDRDGRLQNLLNDRAGLAYRGINTGLDFATQPLGYTGEGAAILGLAGVVSGSGQASLGASLVVAVNNAKHTAQLSGVDASADSIAVVASDGTTIANFAGGLAASSGALAGVAAITANTVLNATSASIGGADAAGQGTKVTARNLTVSAGSQTTLLAGAASIGVSQQFAGGLGLASNVIKANVAAAIAGGTIDASGDAIVRATSAGDATTTASGIAGAGVGAFAGSLVNTIELTKVDAAVTGGTDLKAGGSVAVLAGNSDTSRSLSGTLAVAANADVTVAVGMSIVNSVIKNDTTARIDGGATVDAAGNGAGITGNSGDLASSISLVSLLPGINLVPGALKESQTTRHGLIVNAMSGQSSVNYAISGAFAANVNIDTFFISGAGALLPVNNTIAGSTAARIENAAINTRLTGGGQPDVTVLATDHSLASNAALAVSASTTVAVSGGLANNLMLRTTDAHVSGSRIGAANAAAGAVTVRAAATQQAASFVVGGAATIGAAAGSLTTNVFGSKTTASLSNTAVTAAGTAVRADSANGFYGLTGAFAAGAISVAGGLNLIVDLNETTATVTGGSLTLGGDLDVRAQSKEDIRPFAVGGALSGGLSVAGMANLLVDIATTRAGLYGTTVNAADVTVNAAQAITMMPVTGALSLAVNPATGGVGIGGALNLVLLGSTVAAESQNSSVTASKALAVTASSEKDIFAVTATAGIGSSLGIAGAVGVIVAGLDVQGDAAGQIAGTVNGAKAQQSTNTTSGGVDATLTGTYDNSDALASRQSAVTRAFAPGLGEGVTARITGGTVRADTLTVTAAANSATSNQTFGVSVGAGAYGAALGLTMLRDNVQATAFGDLQANAIQIGASTGDLQSSVNTVETPRAAVVRSGVASLGGQALAGTFATAVVDNVVTASLGGVVRSPTRGQGSVAVGAGDASSVVAESYGAAVALANAVGASVATALKSSTVSAGLAATSTPSGSVAPDVGGYNTVAVTAQSAGSVRAFTVAGAGGLGVAGQAAIATARDTATVTAGLDAGAIVAANSLTINALAVPQVSAQAYGVAVGGVGGLGAAVATAEAIPTVRALIGAGADLSQAGAVNLGATGALATSVPISGNDYFSDRRSRYDTTGQSGKESAFAKTGAGSGSLLFGGVVNISRARTAANVQALVGDRVKLPAGLVGVNALNTTSANAWGLGVAAGLVGLGVVSSDAEADSTTYARLGDGVTTASGRKAGLTVNAAGNDSLNATAIAGTVGFIAGNGAIATTGGTSDVQATLGRNNAIAANGVTVAASHTASTANRADTYNASIVGGSAASATNRFASDVTAGLGSGTRLDVAGSGTATGVSITAQNTFLRPVGDTASAGGGAGGGLTATAALSETTFSGTAATRLDDGVVISAGSDPVLDAGRVSIVASTIVYAVDSVALTTGGVIQGAGVESRVKADVANAVEIGNAAGGATIGSFGVINVGTYANILGNANGYVSTGGLAAIGSANARTDLIANQTVTVAAGSNLTGFDNVYVTAGRDTLGGNGTVLTGSANAQGYVRGLIAVPDADARVYDTSNTSVSIAGAVRSAQNVTIGGYQGVTSTSAQGTGHGYELGFIPVSRDSTDTGTTATSNVSVSGAVTAGIYNDTRVTIADAAAGQGNFGANREYRVDTRGAPVTIAFDPNFSVASFLNRMADATVRQTLASGTQANAPTFALSQLYAAGGSITINADRYAGNGTLTANGSPTITVDNSSKAYLYLTGGAYIPNTGGGRVIFTGLSAADHPATGGSGAAPSITIANTSPFLYPAAPGADGYGPAILIAGDITNLGGLVQISNRGGSYGSVGSVAAQTFGVDVPNGVFAVSADQFFANAAPQAAFNGSVTYPGGNPVNGMPSATDAINYLASALRPGAGTTDALNEALIGHAWQTEGRNSTVLTKTGNGFACLPFVGGSSGCARGGDNYRISDSDSDGYPGFAKVTWKPLQYASDSYPALDPTVVPRIYGGRVAISANVIDINASITVGQPTNQSVLLSSALTQTATSSQVFDHFDYQFMNGRMNLVPIYRTVVTGGDIAVARATNAGKVELTSGVSVVNPGDAQIRAYYDTATDRVTLDRVNASTGSAYLYLKGAIINTSNTLGRIVVNGGLGKVDVQNQTGIGLVVNDVNTGNATLAELTPSRVKIWDTLKAGNNTTTYVYSPGGGLLTYLTRDGADPTAGAAAAQVSSGNTATYNPLANARYQWIQEATLGRTITTVDANNGQYLLSDWGFTSANGVSAKSGIANDPWLYRAADGSLQASPTGRIVVGSTSGRAFEQTITGSAGGNWTFTAHYHDCGDSYCNFAFRRSGDHDPFPGKYYGQPYAEWVYSFPLSAQLTLTNSVKADNPIGITFAVNDTASVRVTSNSTVTLAGAITNANGLLTVNATAGDIVQTGAASTLTKGLTLNASGAIGSATQAVTAALTGGSVKASAGKTVNLAFTTDATLDSVSAGSAAAGYADVSVSAAGTVRAGTPGANGANVTGGSITLTSANGSIGAGNAPLVIAANPAAASAAGTPVGGVVTVKATGDLALRQIAGDLRVGQIASSTGNVTVEVPNGRIIDAAGQTSASVLTAAQLKQVETSLQLVAPGNGGLTSAQQATVTGFQRLIDSDLAAYRSLTGVGSTVAGGTAAPDAGVLAFYRGLAQADAVARARSTGGAVGTLTDADVRAFIAASHAANGTYVVDPAQRAAVVSAYRDRASVTLGLPAGTATDAQVLAYLDAQYQGQVQHFTQAFGTDWKADVARQTTPFVADATLVTALTKDQVWDPRQLVSFVDRSSLQPAPVTIGSTSTADIVGARVSLSARDGIGRLAAPVSISLADLQNGNLTPEQVAALAVSSNPGSVTLVGTRNGQVVSGFDINSVPADVTLTGVVIGETAPVFVSAADRIDASSAGSIFLQGTANPQSAGSTLRIGTVTAGGDVKLLAPDSLVGLSGGVNVTAKGTIDLAAGSAIGSAATPFTIADGTLRLVSAGTNAYVAAPTGRLAVGRASAGGVLSLAAKSDIVGALSGVSASAGTILLTAGGDIGAQGSPFQVQTLAGGQLSGTVGGSAYLAAPLVADRNPTDFTIGTLSAGTDLVLGSGTGLVIRDSATALAGRLTVEAVSLAMNAGSRLNAGQGIALRTTGAAILGQVATTGRTAAADTITVSADTITGNGDGQINLATVGPDAGVLLTARNGVGTAALPLILRTARFSGSTVAGDLRIAARDGLRATTLSAGGGIVVTGTGDLALDAVTSGLGLSAQAGGALGIGTARSGTDMQLGAIGALRFAVLTAGGGATLDAGGAVSGGDLSAQGAVRLTAGLGATGNTLAAGTDATLTAGSDITWNGVTAAGILTGRSKGTLTLATAQSGTDTTLDAEGGLAFGTLAAGGSAGLKAGATIQGGTLTTGADALLTAGSDITWSDLAAGRALVARSGGGLGIGSARSGADTTLTSGGDLVFRTLDSGGAGTLDAGGSVRGGALTAAGSVLLTAAGGASGDTLSAGTDARLVAGSDLVWSGITTGGRLDAQSKGVLTVATAKTGADMTLTALRWIGFTTLTAGGAVALEAGQRIDGGQIAATTDARLTAGSDITWSDLTAGRALVARAGGGLGIGSARSGADTTLNAGGDLVFRTLESGGAGSLDAGGAVRGGALTAAGSVLLTAGGGTSGNTLNAGMDATLTAGSDVAWSGIRAGGALAVQTKGSVAVTSARSGSDTTIAALGGIRFDGLTAGRSAGLDAGQGIQGGVLSAFFGAGLKAGADIAWNSITAGGGLSAQAGRTLTFDTARTGGDATLASTGDLVFRALDTGGKALLDGGGAVRGTTLTAGGSVALTAGGETRGDTLTATDAAGLKAGSNLAWRQIITGRGADLTLEAGGDIDSALLKSGGNLAVTNGGNLQAKMVQVLGSARLTTAGTSTGEAISVATGDLALTSGGTLTWDVLQAASGTLAIDVTGGAARLGVTGSGGAQTIRTAGDLGFSDLTSGATLDAAVGGSLAGTSMTAGGTIRLVAAGDNRGVRMTSRGGDVALSAGGTLDWGLANVAGRFGATSTGGAVRLGSIYSGTGQTIAAAGDVGLTFLGAGGDVTIDSGATITGGSIETNGSARLVAVRDNTGDRLLARTGLIDLQGGGLVRWNGLNAAGRLSVVSTDGAVAVQRATSGAEMVLAALRDVGFGTLKAGGNLDLRSLSGAVRGGDAAAGGTLTAAGTPIVFNTLAGDTGLVLRSAGDVTGNAVRSNGDISVDAAGTITLNGLDGAGIALSTPGGLKLSTLVAHRAVTLAARTIDVGLLRQAADYAGPLNLTVTGYGGTTGDSARLNIDAAQTRLPTLNQAAAQFTTTGGDFAVGAGTITGRFSLATPLAFLQMDNRDPTPRLGNSVQLFQPSNTFTLDQRGYTTTTTAFVVGYDTTMAIRDLLDGQIYLGASFVRDFDRTSAMSRATSGVFRDATIVPGLGSPGPILVKVGDPGQPGVNLGTDPEQFGDAIEDGRIVPARQDRPTGQAARPQ